MANNPYVNKVVYGNDTVMDISDTTATEGDVVNGKTFYKASGARSTGSAVIPDISNCYETTDTAETTIADADYFPFYDSSASGKRNTLWSNIKEKLKSYFTSLYVIELTKAEYEALPSADKNDPDKVYYVYDDTSDGNFYYLERSDITVSNIATAVRIPASGTDPNIHTTSNVVSIVSDSGAGWRTITINEGYVEVLVSKTFTSKAIGIYVDNR